MNVFSRGKKKLFTLKIKCTNQTLSFTPLFAYGDAPGRGIVPMADDPEQLQFSGVEGDPVKETQEEIDNEVRGVVSSLF